MGETRLYRTSDIHFAAYLCSIDFPLTTTENESSPNGHRKVVFVFTIPNGAVDKVKAAYFGGTGTVKARKFVDNLRSLKSMCFT
jgi:hypothetical protein